jgi:hypothetical protein
MLVLPETRIRLLNEHRRHRGWLLLDDAQPISGALCVAEGKLCINGSDIHAVDLADGANGVFSALTQATQAAWEETPPALQDTWAVAGAIINNPPCLFVSLMVCFALLFFSS